MRLGLISAIALLTVSASPAFARERSAPKAPRSSLQTQTSAPQTLAPLIIPAAATDILVDPINSEVLNTYHTEIFGATLAGMGDFHDVFSFTLDDPYDANSQVSTIDLAGIGVTFNSIFLDGNEYTMSDGGPNKYVLDPAVGLLAGLHNIYVNGTIGSAGSGSYSGNLNLITQAPSGVPEPATWAMMLFGFGGVGFAMRRKKSTRALAQIA